MPWSGKQAQAIFLQKKRELGSEEKARAWMRRHGNRSGRHSGNALMDAHRKSRGK
jgi:hypothetical protein